MPVSSVQTVIVKIVKVGFKDDYTILPPPCYRGRRSGLLVSALDPGSSGPGSSPDWGHIVLCSWARHFTLNAGVNLRWTGIPSLDGMPVGPLRLVWQTLPRLGTTKVHQYGCSILITELYNIVQNISTNI